MATVTGLTAERMQEIIDATIVDADVIGDNLILTKDDGSTIDAGSVRGAPGADGGGGGIAKVSAFPTVPPPEDGDMIVRIDLPADPVFKFTDGAWEQQPRLGALTIPAAKAYASSSQSLPDGVLTAISFDTEAYDTDGIHDLVTNTTRFTIKTAGLYHINGIINFAGTNPQNGQREVVVKVNGVNVWDAEGQPNTVTTEWTSFPYSLMYKLAAGDYVEVFAYQNSGFAANITSGIRWATAVTWQGGAGQTVDERGVAAVRATIASGTQTIPSSSSALISFPTEDFDTEGMHDISTNTTRLTIKTPGLYDIHGFAQTAADPIGGFYSVNVFKNGANLSPDPYMLGVFNSDTSRVDVSGHAVLAAGDYIELQFSNGTSNSITINRAYLSAVLIGSAKTVTPFARVIKDSTTGLSSGAENALAFNIEKSDNDNIHDTGLNTSRLTCRTSGVYCITGHIAATGGSNLGIVYIKKNGSQYLANESNLNSGGSITTTVELAVGDYVELIVKPSSGITLDGSSDTDTYQHLQSFEMVKVGAPNVGGTGIGPAQANVYTVATLPAANTFPNGRIVGVSDGAAGQQARMAMAGAWLNLG